MRFWFNILVFCFIQCSFGVRTLQAFAANDNNTLVRHQEPDKTENGFVFYSTRKLNLIANQKHALEFNQVYTSILVTGFNKAQKLSISTGQENYVLNGSNFEFTEESTSNFIIFKRPIIELEIVGSINDSVHIELFYAPELSLKKRHEKTKKNNSCAEPSSISQAVWRVGLPDPKSGRTPTEVKHCIIHHSAGSNSDTNYTNVVRNIYLFHTQSNGWDDIGYNYLIAQDGTIYKGRDPQNFGDQDNIQGAHFCSKNAGTMGICLLGNFNTTSPRDTALASLQRILTFKLHKEDLSAYDQFNHPNELGTALDVIAGHQDGCATACPGDSLYGLLSDIKDSVQSQLEDCTPSASVIQPPSYKALIYPNPSTGCFYVTTDRKAGANRYTLVGINGSEIEQGYLPPNGYIQTSVDPGLYYLKIWYNQVLLAQEKMIIALP